MTNTTVKEFIGFELNIQDIESLKEIQAAQLAEDSAIVKGHNVYFVDFGGYFGYSVLVYKNKHHIYFANDYQLHHSNKSRAELYQLYIESLNNKLFTEEELTDAIGSYDEYQRKDYFIRNYYGMQKDYISIFFIGSDDERAERKKQFEGKIFNPIALAYYKSSDSDFVNHHKELSNTLEQRKEEMTSNFEFLKNAYLYEMWNHEYGYNWQGDYDVLSCFGHIRYNSNDDLQDYFEQLHFTEVEKSAYFAARKEYGEKFEG